MQQQTALNRGEATGDTVPQCFNNLVKPHVESFDYFVGEGIRKVFAALEPVRIHLKERKETWQMWLENASIGKPSREEGGRAVPVMPRECREMGTTYRGPLQMEICVQKEGSSDDVLRVGRSFGSIPIMVCSKNCHLRNLNRQQMIAAKEEANEFGGVFICNGIERMIRMLIQQRRHYVMALRRSAYQKRGSKYTDAATLLRCVRPDQSSATVRLHYLKDGNVNFALTVNRAEYFIPVGMLLKAFAEVSDKQLFDRIVAGCPGADDRGSGHASFVADRAELVVRAVAAMGCKSKSSVLAYLGGRFRTVLRNVHVDDSDIQVGERLVRDHVFIHLTRDADRFNLMLEMLHKLYALVNLQCCADNADALCFHEILLPGQLLVKMFREKMEDCMAEFAAAVVRDAEKAAGQVNLASEVYVRKLAERMPDVGHAFEHFFSTGNLSSRSGLDLSQTTGFTVVAEKLNFFRYMSHFRSVHRGAFFQQMRTTTVRKLLPESWGFLCPVHTPDGSPCGLLNHLTHTANVVAHDPPDEAATHGALNRLLALFGVVPADAPVPPRAPAYLPVSIDGRLVGHVRADRAPAVVAELRLIKARHLACESGQASPAEVEAYTRLAAIPSHTEVCLLPYERGGPFHGLLLFTQQARLARPVRQLATNRVELIGTLEQSNMHIRCPDGGNGGSHGLRFTHQEIHSGSMLSEVASFTPFSDFNQSPRNMYQCQMGKQTMGTPCYTYGHRTDTKLYRIQSPQRPVARTKRYDEHCMDEHAQGTNMVVCVIAYTGYDMEDAMILNQSAVDRGLAHGSVYKTECIDLKESKGASMRVFAPEAQPEAKHAKDVESYAENPPSGAFGDRFPQNRRTVSGAGLTPDACHADSDRIDVDGLPHVGAVVWPSQPYVNTFDEEKLRHRASKLKGEEQAIVQQVTLLGARQQSKRAAHEPHQRANVTLRFNRNPCVGDKFASRAGQKGVLGQLWPDVDMPFCARTGMRPDLIINPHAFPSRMTIGMLVESMASKAAVLEGRFVDATPFQKCDDPEAPAARDPVKYFGDMLEARGFARHGQETMVSGYTGEEMACDIYIGLVYYQRLRHMVKDKFQVRSTGKNNQLTRQPVKGRQVGGGIRFGEMERDSLLAHGAAYLLHDRLHYCSDYHVADVCTACGSMLTPLNKPSASQRLVGGTSAVSMLKGQGAGTVVCTNAQCSGGAFHIERVAVPYVFRYLASELAAMNIKVTLTVR